MSKAIVLNENFENIEEIALPDAFNEINSHNLYIYTKAYLAGLRESSANTKTRSTIRGGGKKPFAQKGGGRARQGSTRSPQFRGGAVAFGPTNERNFIQKVNKKQQKLALCYALNEKAKANKLFVIDSIKVESGKTKDAKILLDKLDQRNSLVIKESINFADDGDVKTFLSMRNLANSLIIEANEIDAYLVSSHYSVVVEKSVFDNLVSEG